MASVDLGKIKLLPILSVLLLSGCSMSSLLMQEEDVPQSVEPVVKEQAAVCPSCSVEERLVAPSGDCAKAVAVVNYADSCQACGRFPVTVRAYGSDENCR